MKVSLTVDVISKSPVDLEFDSPEAYEVQYQMHVWGTAGDLTLDFTDSFTYWMVPYLGAVKRSGI